MPALRKKERDEHEAVFGPRPLPAHFGEIDLIAPFDATRFFTALRCAGYNPQVTRKDDGSLFYGFDVWRQHSVLQRDGGNRRRSLARGRIQVGRVAPVRGAISCADEGVDEGRPVQIGPADHSDRR
jgi:hypothetical protein